YLLSRGGVVEQSATYSSAAVCVISTRGCTIGGTSDEGEAMATVEALGSIGIGIFTVTILIGAFWCIIREQRRNDEAILRDMHERHQLEWFELQREIAEARQRLDAEKPKHAERQHKISQVLSDDGELIDVHLFYSPEDNGWIANIPSLQYCSAF